MKKHRPSMSQMVLDRQKTRRDKRVRIGIIIFVILTFIAGQVSNHYFDKQRLIAMGKVEALLTREIEEKNAPTWADFSVAKGVHEQQSFISEDGVPNHVTINGELWTIVHVNNFTADIHHKYGEYFSGIGGETFCSNKTIAYISSNDMRVLKINIMHEIFHAGDCYHGGDTWWNSEKPSRNSHPGIYHLGEFMATFLHDNPQFAAWEAQ
jgi:hypothetical protein